MTQTPPDAPGSGTQDSGPRVSGEQMRDLGRLRRSITDRKVAGVAGGLGRHLDIDPTLLRVAFVVLAFFGGAGILLYGAAWLLVPEDGQQEAAIASSTGTRTTALIVVAVVAGLLAIGDGWGAFGWGFGFPWPLLLIGVAILLVLGTTRSSPQQPSPLAQGPVQAGAEEVPAAPTQTQTPTPNPTQTQTLAWQPAPVVPDRGPRLFWPTIALVTLAVGVLWTYEVAGGTVVDAAYPALALTVIGLMLVAGAWAGRTGGLIFIGIVAAIALAVSSVVPRFAAGEIDRMPTTASQLDESYTLAAGAINLDLTNIDDVEALDGRSIAIDSTMGRVVVIVPDDVDVNVNARVDGAGELDVFGRVVNGPDLTAQRTVDGGVGAPELDIDIDMTFGRVEVRTA